MQFNPGEVQPNRAILVILAAILIVGFSLRAWNLFSQGFWSSDGLLYYELSRGLLEDGRVLSGKSVRTIITRSNLEFYDNFFLQGKYGHILLILASFLVAGVKVEAVLLLNLVLGTATLYVIFILGKVVFGEETGIASAAVAALSLIFINYSRTGLTPSGSMFFFALGLFFFFRHLKEEPSNRIFCRLFGSGLLIGFAFTIHYNLAYYFLLIYFSHLIFALSSGENRFNRLKDNFIFAAGLTLPLVMFEFGYPFLYYAIYKKYILYTYFQEVLYNALEAGGGSSRWNYFIIYLSLAEGPAFCVMVFVAIGGVLFQTIKENDVFKGFFLLFALLPPVFLSFLNFPLVGRNLAPSLPLFAVMTGFAIVKIAKILALSQRSWVTAGFVLALMGLSLFHLAEAYQIQAPMIQARNDANNKPVLLVGKDELYREAILYRVSDTISVAPSVESILKDPKSKEFLLLAKRESALPLSCDPLKTYRIFDRIRFRPMFYEDRIAKPEPGRLYQDIFSLYDLSTCLASHETIGLEEERSITTIGQNYNIVKTGLTSPARIHFATGMRYLTADHHGEAVYEFKKTLRFNPNMTQAHNNLAFALSLQGRFDEAEAHLKEANRLAFGLLETQNLFGLTYALKGELNRAIQHFENATRIDPNHPTAYQNLLYFYSQFKKDPEKVRIYSEKLLQLSSGGKPLAFSSQSPDAFKSLD